MQTGLPLTLELVQLVATLALVVPGLHYAFGAYVRHRRPNWSGTVERRRLAILVLLVCAVTAIQIGEDVMDRDSHPIDRMILLFIHEHVSGPVIGLFEAITVTGSLKVLFPLTAAVTIVLLVARRRFEALLLATSTIVGALVVYAIKTMVQRQRPKLWDTELYWGSSFPSGHTLVVAAFATAALLCVARVRPSEKPLALWIALTWIALVGLSRLVLGVHWPTDVLVAACLGAFIPLTISVAHELRNGERTGES